MVIRGVRCTVLTPCQALVGEVGSAQSKAWTLGDGAEHRGGDSSLALHEGVLQL